MSFSNVTCTYESLSTTSDQCGAIEAGVCSDQVNVVNLFWVYFCVMQGHIYYLVPSGIVLLLFLFDIISSTCENWLTDPLTKIGKTLHFSEALSGVTLIALANGSPDVIASFSAAGQPPTDGASTFLAVGSIFGANLFTTTVVLFRVLTNTDSIKMQYQTILRDLIFFIVATISIIVFGFIGYINQYMTIGYVILYLSYCAIVLIQEKTVQSPSKEEEPEATGNNQEPLTTGASESDPEAKNRKQTQKKTIYEIEKEMMKDLEERIFVQEYQGVDHLVVPQIKEERPNSGVSLQPVPETSLDTPSNLLQIPKSGTGTGDARVRAKSVMEQVME